MNGHTAKEIQLVVCRQFGLERDVLLGMSRARKFARPRQIAMYLARQRTKLSLPQIGSAFYRDHTTIIHACKRIQSLMEMNPKVFEHVMACEEALGFTPAWKASAALTVATVPLVQRLEAA